MAPALKVRPYTESLESFANPERGFYTTRMSHRMGSLDVVRRATEAVGEYGSRVSLVLKADIRPGYAGELDAKVERLEAALGDD